MFLKTKQKVKWSWFQALCFAVASLSGLQLIVLTTNEIKTLRNITASANILQEKTPSWASPDNKTFTDVPGARQLYFQRWKYSREAPRSNSKSRTLSLKKTTCQTNLSLLFMLLFKVKVLWGTVTSSRSSGGSKSLFGKVKNKINSSKVSVWHHQPSVKSTENKSH